MDVLARNDGSNGVRFLSVAFGTIALELQTLLFQTGLDSLSVAVVVFTVLDWNDVVLMLLWENLTVLHWLHGGVVVVLVDLTVNGGGGLLMTGLDNSLVNDGGSDLLVHSGIVVTGLGPGRGETSALVVTPHRSIHSWSRLPWAMRARQTTHWCSMLSTN